MEKKRYSIRLFLRKEIWTLRGEKVIFEDEMIRDNKGRWRRMNALELLAWKSIRPKIDEWKKEEIREVLREEGLIK